MSHDHAEPFRPPTASQVRSLLDRCPPLPPSRMPRWLVLGLVGLCVGMMLVSTNPLVSFLPMVAIVAMVVLLSRRAQAVRSLERAVVEVGDLATTRHMAEALRRAWALLPQLVRHPELHGRTISIMAYALARSQSHEAALVAYDYLLDRLPPGHPIATQLQVQRIIPQLMTDRLADADDAIRRLRQRIAEAGDPAIAAAYRFGQLAQHIRTFHYAEAVVDVDTLVDTVRPLGVDAGYAYALVALAYHAMAGDDRADDDGRAALRELYGEQAATWWARATTLVPLPRLVEQFGELKALVDAGIPAADRPDDKEPDRG